MKTIKSLIEANAFELEAAKNVRADEQRKKVYAAYPELRQIDDDLIQIQSSRFVAVIDGDQRLIERLDIADKNLNAKRIKFLEHNNISPDFDETKAFCDKCEDSGFYTDSAGVCRVCSCKSKELKECFDASGLADYPTYDTENFHSDYFGKSKEEERRSIMRALFIAIRNSGTPNGKNPAILYYDQQRSGKTFLAVKMCKDAIRMGKSAFYTRAEELAFLSENILEDLKRYDFLVIDDYEPLVTFTNNVGSILNTILEVRAASNLPTVLITKTYFDNAIGESDMRVSGKIDDAQRLPAEQYVKKPEQTKKKEA